MTFLTLSYNSAAAAVRRAWPILLRLRARLTSLPYKRILLFSMLIVVLLIAAQVAQADPKSEYSCGLDVSCHVVSAVNGILWAVGRAIWALARMAAQFMNWVLVDFYRLARFADSPFVQVGWAAVRDIANWFFVVFFLVSAIATVLDLPRYNARAILPKLLIMAVLVNFSLFITGFVVNVANIVMYAFVSAGPGSTADGALNLYNSLAAGGAGYSYDTYTAHAATQSIAKTEFLLKEIGFLVTSSAIGLFVAFIFAFIAFLLITRVVYLWVTMILSPLAFVLTTFPATQNFFQKWSKRFIDQAVFGVIAAFFLWLAGYLAITMDDLLSSSGSPVGDSNPVIFLPDILRTSTGIVKGLTIFVFLYLGMKLAKEMSGEAGQFVFKGMKQALGVAAIAGTGGAALAARGAGAAGAAAYRRAPGTSAPVAERVNRAVARVPVLRGIGERGLAKQQDYIAGRAERVDRKEYKKRPDKDIDASAKGAARASVMTDSGAAAIVEAHTRGRDMQKLGVSEDKIVKALQRMDRLNQADDAKKADPVLAAKAGVLKSQKEGTHNKDQAGQIAAIEKYTENMSTQDAASLRKIDLGAAMGPDADPVRKAMVEGIREGMRDGSFGGRQLSAVARKAQDDKGAERVMRSLEGLLKSENRFGQLHAKTVDQINKDPILTRAYDIS